MHIGSLMFLWKYILKYRHLVTFVRNIQERKILWITFVSQALFDAINTALYLRCPYKSEAATGGVLWKHCPEQFLKIHKKTPVLNFLFNELAGLVCSFIKQRLQHRCFPVNIAKFLKNAYFKEHLRAAACDEYHSSWIHKLFNNVK